MLVFFLPLRLCSHLLIFLWKEHIKTKYDMFFLLIKHLEMYYINFFVLLGILLNKAVFFFIHCHFLSPIITLKKSSCTNNPGNVWHIVFQAKLESFFSCDLFRKKMLHGISPAHILVRDEFRRVYCQDLSEK